MTDTSVPDEQGALTEAERESIRQAQLDYWRRIPSVSHLMDLDAEFEEGEREIWHNGEGRSMCAAVESILTARLASPVGAVGEAGLAEKVAEGEYCRRCGGPNVIWCAPSPLWNLVMRENDIDGPTKFSDLVCMKCFTELAAEKGITRQWRLTGRAAARGAQDDHAERSLVGLDPLAVARRRGTRMTSETRVVLVKPGDMLILGNVGSTPMDMHFADGLRAIKDALKLAHVVVFTEEIDLAAVPKDELHALLATPGPVRGQTDDGGEGA